MNEYIVTLFDADNHLIKTATVEATAPCHAIEVYVTALTVPLDMDYAQVTCRPSGLQFTFDISL